MAMFLLVLTVQFVLTLANLQPLPQESHTCAIPNSLLTIGTETCIIQKSSSHKPEGPLNGASPPRQIWKSGGLCLGIRADKFCVFTNPSFNHGEGISVITGRKSMATIATRTAFSASQNEGVKADLTPPYREVEITGKGIGLVATRKIRTGELIMAQTPSVMVNEKAVRALTKRELSDLLVRAVELLPSQHQKTLANLSTHSETKIYEDKLHKILETNSFRTGYHDGDNPFYSLFTEVSRLNHDCRPTCAYYFDHTDFHQEVLVVRDVEPGEELTIAYYDPLQTHSVRQEKLYKEWGFRCACQRCSADASSIAESDHRVLQIKALLKELDDHSEASKASPEKAELLVSLYEQEGMLGRLNEAYYRAALEYIGVGDVDNAKKYAAMCVDQGLLYIGPERPFIKSMQDLIENPPGHPKWKFRLGTS